MQVTIMFLFDKRNTDKLDNHFLVLKPIYTNIDYYPQKVF